jgi:FkbM family methyltransferase
MVVDFVYKGHQIHMILHDESDKLSLRILNSKTFWGVGELEKSIEHINKSSTVIDCGANIGNHTVFWGMFCKKVIAFEPFKANFDLLEKNIAANSINAEAHRLVMSDTVGRFSSTEITPNLGGIRFLKDDNGEYHSNTLDNIVKNKVDLLKIDVEGDEVEVLRGAKRILQEDHPTLFIEVHFIRDNMDKECLEVLKQYGYQEDVDVFLKRLNKSKGKKFRSKRRKR